MRRYICCWFDPFDLVVAACSLVYERRDLELTHSTFCRFDGEPAVELSTGCDFRFDCVERLDFELFDPELASLSLPELSLSLSEIRSTGAGDADFAIPLSLSFSVCVGSGEDDSSALESSTRSSLSIPLGGMLPIDI